MRHKEKIHKLAKQTGNPRLLAKWKAFRADIKRDIKVAHDEYVNYLIGDISDHFGNTYIPKKATARVSHPLIP